MGFSTEVSRAGDGSSRAPLFSSSFSSVDTSSLNPQLIYAILAGVPGFEPGLSVLETDVLTVDTIPLQQVSVVGCQVSVVSGTRHRNPAPYFVSLCDVCLRQRRQNLLNSKRSVVVFLFLVVT